jgi:menaquinone-dependent protoporphyrinogen oxidase
MARILVIYGTTDGHTARIARELGVALSSAGADVEVQRACRSFLAMMRRPDPALPGPEGYDGVIVAASLRAGRFQAPVRQWIRCHAAKLAAVPGAFLPVCLMVRNPKAAPTLAAIVSRFLDGCGWHPGVVKPIAGALLYTRYPRLTRWMMRRIAARTGNDTDTSRDHVYTDWDDVRRFAREFLRRIESRGAVRVA